MNREIKPKIFIGSSAKCKCLLDSLYIQLSDDYKVIRWDKEFFEPSKFPMECLEEKAKIFDFAIFILHPDDIMVNERDVTIKTRDNVIFEYGLFMGVLGRNNVFLLEPNPNHLKVTFPSDFYGITTIRYDYDENEVDMVGVGIRIKEQINIQEKRKANIIGKNMWPLRVSIISCDQTYVTKLMNCIRRYDNELITLTVFDNYADAMEAMRNKEMDCAFVDIFSIDFEQGIDMILYARDRHREIGFAIYGDNIELRLLLKVNNIHNFTLEHYWKLKKDANIESFQISVEDTLIMFYIYKLTGGHFGEVSGDVITKIFKPNVIGGISAWSDFI